MEILHGHSERLAAIAAKAMEDILGGGDFGPCQAIGVVTGQSADDKLHAIAVYHEYQPVHKTCMISFVSFSPRWATKKMIRNILSVPFLQYDVKKLWATTSKHNKRCHKLLLGVGFIQEAVLANHFGAGNHAHVFRMMDTDWQKVMKNKFDK